ncbi:MAG TPA: superinfection immunity protein [Candidatus Omnitrophota bacterium]|nr:superinfection immunity protein [Candidatus Omnitrophota bacterium]HRY86121.1 superinfection immunity protein [Candidatus Omnitrophota bacterium]
MEVVIVVVAIIVGLFVYFIPTSVASGKKQSTQVFVVNFFFGWSLIGWVIALVWALQPDEKLGATPAELDVEVVQTTSGSVIVCPQCKVKNHPQLRVCWKCKTPFVTERRKCPSCAELIKKEAKKCRYCGTEVSTL